MENLFFKFPSYYPILYLYRICSYINDVCASHISIFFNHEHYEYRWFIQPGGNEKGFAFVIRIENLFENFLAITLYYTYIVFATLLTMCALS